TGKLLRTERTHEPVDQLAFSRDGKILAFSCVDQISLRLFEVDGWKEVFPLPARHGIRFFALSPDHKTLAGLEDGGRLIRLYDLAQGKEIRQLQGHQQGITCLVFSADGKSLASASSDKTIRLWDVATGKELQALSGDQYTPSTLAFAPDGKTLASANFDGLIRIWDLPASKIIGPREGHQDIVSSEALSADGKTLFSARSDATIRQC